MFRHTIQPRSNWIEKVESLGFLFHSEDNLYWDESAYYSFDAAQIDMLESATQEVFARCLDAVQWVIDSNWFERLHIPPQYIPYIRKSWEEDETRGQSIYGRFDFVFDGHNPPKMLEFNADTPTALFEASVVQWYWLQDCFPDADQFNGIHEKLIAQWEHINQAYGQVPIYFTCLRDHAEDLSTTEYLRDTALQAGVDTRFIFLEDVGWHQWRKTFIDLDDAAIKVLFKLYPYEWLIHEDYGRHLLDTDLILIEPAWKMILSNKAILVLLSEMFPHHPNLLPTYFEPITKLANSYVKKPIFAREGANVTIHDVVDLESTTGDYGTEGFVYQAFQALPNFDYNYPVIGSWVIGGEAAGIGIRESDSLITTNKSRFVPHLFN